MSIRGMRRRAFIAALGGAAAWPLVARAQQPGKIYPVGLLGGGAAIGATDERRVTLLSALAARGFINGQNLVFEQRWADAHAERLGDLAAELKGANVDVVITFGYPAALAAKGSHGLAVTSPA
jgi:putative ABC transport system substrate-binding protein